MAAGTIELQAAEHALIKLFPLRMLAYGAFLGNILAHTGNVLVAIANPRAVDPLLAILSAAVSAFTFLLYSNALSKLGRTQTRIMAYFAWLLFAVNVTSVLLLTLIAFGNGIGAGLIWAAFLGEVIVLTWAAASGWWSLFKLDEPTRRVLASPFEGLISRAAMRTYSGLPPIIEFVRKRRLTVYALCLLSTSCLVLAVFALLLAPVLVLENPPGVQGAALVGGVTLFCLFALAANAFLRLARDRIRFSIDELISEDPRRPILYLRAFQDDRVVLPSPRRTLLGRLLALGSRPQTLDELLLEEGTLYGPLVALGDPRDSTAPYGAARGYFSNQNWQQAVTDLASSALAIVICLDDTDAVWWEVDLIAQRGFAAKTLFLVPPKYAAPHSNARLCTQVLQRLGHREGAMQTPLESWPDGAIGFFADNAGGVQVGRSSTFSRDGYFAMLRLFLRAKHGIAVRVFDPKQGGADIRSALPPAAA